MRTILKAFTVLLSLRWTRVPLLGGSGFRLHWALWLTPLWLLPFTWGETGSPPAAIKEAVSLALILALAITVHEAGHFLASQCFGVGPGEIVLGGLFGGWIPNDMRRLLWLSPSRQFLIIAAGPAANLTGAALVWAFLARSGMPNPLDWLAGLLRGLIPSGGVVIAGASFPSGLGFRALAGVTVGCLGDAPPPLSHWFNLPIIEVNLAVGIINLIPVYPLDGGRLVRAVLAMLSVHDRCIRIFLLLAVIVWGGGVLTAMGWIGNVMGVVEWVVISTVSLLLLWDTSPAF